MLNLKMYFYGEIDSLVRHDLKGTIKEMLDDETCTEDIIDELTPSILDSLYECSTAIYYCEQQAFFNDYYWDIIQCHEAYCIPLPNIEELGDAYLNCVTALGYEMASEVISDYIDELEDN